MASEDVCILLNERESAKERLSETLLVQLKQANITAHRLKADPKIEKIVKQRHPRVLILDYVIGDFTTGLDLLTAISSWPEKPEVIFLTDEPSIQVAVEALKLGAKDYLLIDNPDLISRVLEETTSILSQKESKAPTKTVRPVLKLKNFIAQSPTSIGMIERARTATSAETSLLVIHGPIGSGRSSLAQAIQDERNGDSTVHNVDWDLYPFSANKLAGLDLSSENPSRFGNYLSLIVDHAEADDGALYKVFENLLKTNVSSQSRLTICTADHETAMAWSSLSEVPIITIPALTERVDDIPALARLFATEAAEIFRTKAPTLSVELLNSLKKKDWPGNIKQLKTAVYDGIFSSASSERSLNDLIEESYTQALASVELTPKAASVSPLMALNVLDRFAGDYRLAALHLGTTVQNLRQAMRQETPTLNGAGI